MQKIKRLCFVTLCYFFLSNQFSTAQTAGQWTWMKGDSLFWMCTGNWGIQGVPDTLNNPPGLYEAANWTDLQGNFWIYGGLHSSEYGDLWKFDPSTNIWTWINGAGTTGVPPVYGIKGIASPANYPGVRSWGICTWTDLNGDLWMFGGFGFATGEKNDLWKYNISSNMWTWVSGDSTSNSLGNYGTQGIPSVNNAPCSREEVTSTWVDNAGNLWLFGGAHWLPTLNDLWRYNIATNEWTWMEGSNTFGAIGVYGTKGISNPNNTPGARMSYAHWKDKNGNFWLFGGADTALNNLTRNDMWKYDVSINEWTWMSGTDTINDNGDYGLLCEVDTNKLPKCRTENKACWTDSCGNFWMFGGMKFYSVQANTIRYINDLWMYNPSDTLWTFVNGSSVNNQVAFYGTQGVSSPLTNPGSRMGACSWLQNNGVFWIFGGDSDWGSKCDVWKYIPSCEGCNSETGINQISSFTNQIEIFPNPVQNNLVIKFNSELNTQNAVISFYNSLGQKIHSEKLNKTQETIKINFASGLYFVRVLKGENYFCKKIIVEHN